MYDFVYFYVVWTHSIGLIKRMRLVKCAFYTTTHMLSWQASSPVVSGGAIMLASLCDATCWAQPNRCLIRFISNAIQTHTSNTQLSCGRFFVCWPLQLLCKQTLKIWRWKMSKTGGRMYNCWHQQNKHLIYAFRIADYLAIHSTSLSPMLHCFCKQATTFGNRGNAIVPVSKLYWLWALSS